MDDLTTEKRPRNTRRQREAGAAARAETARLLLQSATELFGQHGYTATSVAAIAAHAGVSLQTLYSAWGSKQALFRASLEQALSGEPRIDESWPQQLQQRLRDNMQSDQSSRGFARGLAAVYRGLAERAGPAWLSFRNAAGGDATIAEDWVKLSLLRHGTTRTLLGTAREGEPADKLADDDTRVDTAWILSSPEVFDLLVRVRGYDLGAYEQWLADALEATVN